MLPYQTISQKENRNAIIGIGGAGANVLQCFASSSAGYVRLCTMSLDERVGRGCGNVEFIQLGEGLSHGLGSGGDPEVGRQAMEESADRVREVLAGCKLLVMVVGLGGGTGSGAAPVLARMAREAGLFLVSVVMMPFSFEGKRRREQAELAHEEIARLSDIVFCFENDYMEELFRNRSGARAVFEEVDRLLAKATAAVPMMASSPGLINLGLDELATALENRDSRCIFGSGSGYGAKRAEDAARAALESPLATYHGAIRFARSVIVHIAGGDSMSLTEIRRAMDVVREALGSDDVAIFFGATVKSVLNDEMRVTIVASIDAEEFKASFNRTETTVRPELPATPAPALAPEDDTEPEAEDSEVDSEPDVTDEPDEDAPEPEDEDAEEEEAAFDSAPDEEAEAPAPAPAPAPKPKPAPRPAPAPEPAPEPEPTPRPAQRPAPAPAPTQEPPAAKPKPQQMDLFPTTARQSEYMPGTRYAGQAAPPAREGGSVPFGSYSPDASRRRAAISASDDLDIPPSMRQNDLKTIFPDA